MDYLAGQSVALVKEIKPAAEVITELLEDARRILSTLTMERDAAAARARVLNDLPNRLSARTALKRQTGIQCVRGGSQQVGNPGLEFGDYDPDAERIGLQAAKAIGVAQKKRVPIAIDKAALAESSALVTADVACRLSSNQTMLVRLSMPSFDLCLPGKQRCWPRCDRYIIVANLRKLYGSFQLRKRLKISTMEV